MGSVTFLTNALILFHISPIQLTLNKYIEKLLLLEVFTLNIQYIWCYSLKNGNTLSNSSLVVQFPTSGITDNKQRK